ncbi:hypothetical protein HAV22_05075 [Massilia sp. TW-1]|uniref:Uncharacterized protein n=1 Tax=Telluria antibiotica TaxID=2717319 RepID=A0ABX0P729_9BURK|nr:hypothetical protein [Telluria antibiotica]NIA53026.1 hypothetical protein [Telluria antibiotica]
MFDHYHTQIILNQIDGLDSTGVVSAAAGGSLRSNKIPVPTLFGTNYQTLSVAQKSARCERWWLQGFTEDDVGFIWLNDRSDAARAAAIAALEANVGCPAVDPTSKIIVAGQSNPGICSGTDAGSGVIDLAADGRFGDPAKGRTPDIMVQPNAGVIYSKSAKKDAEHGGAAANDSNVALLVSFPTLSNSTVMKIRHECHAGRRHSGVRTRLSMRLASIDSTGGIHASNGSVRRIKGMPPPVKVTRNRRVKKPATRNRRHQYL